MACKLYARHVYACMNGCMCLGCVLVYFSYRETPAAFYCPASSRSRHSMQMFCACLTPAGVLQVARIYSFVFYHCYLEQEAASARKKPKRASASATKHASAAPWLHQLQSGQVPQQKTVHSLKHKRRSTALGDGILGDIELLRVSQARSAVSLVSVTLKLSAVGIKRSSSPFALYKACSRVRPYE